MLGRLLLDTNAIIQLRAGNKELLELVSSADLVAEKCGKLYVHGEGL